ncbi:MAG: energy transducer TonB [Sphingomonadales bacterium]|nr:energy transducer TonB [Sphingomonadales bacterium]
MGKYFEHASIGAVLVGLLSPGPVAARDAGAQLLQPSSKWSVHYADDFCRLSRTFGEGRDRISLVIDRFQPSDNFRLILAGQPMGGRHIKTTATIRFGTTLPEQRLAFLPGDLGKGGPAWVFSNAIRIRPYADPKDADAIPINDWITAEERASVTTIQISEPFSRARTLNTGPMTDAFAALHRCTEELLGHWGIDVARHATLTRWATPAESPAKWVRSSDYPQGMLAKQQPAMVQFRLIVGADGAPTACHVQQSTNPAGFNEAVCKALMSRARFEPALDAEGKPFPSFFINSVRFEIP